jgi:hypothetical protein
MNESVNSGGAYGEQPNYDTQNGFPAPLRQPNRYDPREKRTRHSMVPANEGRVCLSTAGPRSQKLSRTEASLTKIR